MVSLSAVSVAQSTAVQKYERKTSRSKQSLSFKLHTVLRSTMESHAARLSATWDVNQPFVQ